MRLSIVSLIAAACASLVNATSSNTAKCISKTEATGFVNDFSKVISRAPNWEALAKKITPPDHTLMSGSVTTLHGNEVGDGDAVVHHNRAEWIAELPLFDAFVGIETKRIQVAGCNTIYWHYRRQRKGLTVLTIERFDLRLNQGKWVAYAREVEFDTCSHIGGCNNISKREMLLPDGRE